MRLKGKVALVTGGTRGIGRGVVEMLAAQGAAVAFTGRSQDKGREVEVGVAEAGGSAMYLNADSSQESDVAAAIARTVQRFGALTTLVNSAISDDAGSGRDSHIDLIENDTFENIMRVALMGTFWACKYAIPHMRTAGNGSIINISASSSRSALPERPAYHASKGAINAMTRQLAVDYGKENIRANTIIVGFIYTGSPVMAAILDDPVRRAAFQRNIMVPRFGEPADIAAGVVYLASDESGYVTGSELTIDGGALCHQALPQLNFDVPQGKSYVEQYALSAELRERLDKARANGQRVGMVGTSGALHAGHLSLIQRAAADNDVTALFWGGGTPAGWMDSEIGYARDADRDFALAESAGLDIIFTPASTELFAREPMTRVSLPAMSSGVAHLEDPAHLDLIAMVMCKLWNVFGACRSYFGEKDWQQLVMYQRLAEDLGWPVDVIGCPTIREADGLAVSSRNGQLSTEDRAVAPVLYQALSAARTAALQGETAAAGLESMFAEIIGGHGSIGYFTPVAAATMTPLDALCGPVRLLASLELGGVRLVDNIGLDIPAGR